MGGILDMGKIEMTDEYVRVGTTLYKIVFQPLINGTFAKRRTELAANHRLSLQKRTACSLKLGGNAGTSLQTHIQ